MIATLRATAVEVYTPRRSSPKKSRRGGSHGAPAFGSWDGIVGGSRPESRNPRAGAENPAPGARQAQADGTEAGTGEREPRKKIGLSSAIPLAVLRLTHPIRPLAPFEAPRVHQHQRCAAYAHGY